MHIIISTSPSQIAIACILDFENRAVMKNRKSGLNFWFRHILFN